jgi:MerR family mercuric resistance operon transcriptional regulator
MDGRVRKARRAAGVEAERPAGKEKPARSEMTIGKLAKHAGVNVETIRYYQRRGLLYEPDKPLGGYRRYPADMVKRVRFIKRAQALGFTLEEVTGLLRLDAAQACAETRELAVHKLELIERKLADLAAMREGLAALMAKCDTGGSSACPIIQVLNHD